MQIELCDGKYILNSDNYCFWMEQLIVPEKPKKNNEARKPYKVRCSGYHQTIEGALESFVNRKVGASAADTASKLIKEMKLIRKEVKQIGEELEAKHD